jgi:hypothetical protein
MAASLLWSALDDIAVYVGAHSSPGRKAGSVPALLLHQVEAALRGGADPNHLRDSVQKTTPLAAAVALQLPDLVELLLRYGADAVHDRKAYRMAMASNDADIFRLLLAHRYPETVYVRNVAAAHAAPRLPRDDPRAWNARMPPMATLREEHRWRTAGPPNPRDITWPEDAVPAINTFLSIPTRAEVGIRGSIASRLLWLVARTTALPERIALYDTPVLTEPPTPPNVEDLHRFLAFARRAVADDRGTRVLTTVTCARGTLERPDGLHKVLCIYQHGALIVIDTDYHADITPRLLRALEQAAAPDTVERAAPVGCECGSLQREVECRWERGYCVTLSMYLAHVLLLNPDRDAQELVTAVAERPAGYLRLLLRRYRCWLLSLYAAWYRAEHPGRETEVMHRVPDFAIGSCRQRSGDGDVAP